MPCIFIHKVRAGCAVGQPISGHMTMVSCPTIHNNTVIILLRAILFMLSSGDITKTKLNLKGFLVQPLLCPFLTIHNILMMDSGIL